MAKHQREPSPEPGSSGLTGAVNRALTRHTSPSSVSSSDGALGVVLVDRRLRVVQADLPPSLDWVNAHPGQPVTDLLPPPAREPVTAGLHRVLDMGEKLLARPQRLQQPGGEPVVLSFTALPDDGGLLVTLIDITAKQELFAALGVIGNSLDIPTTARQVVDAVLPWGTGAAISLSDGVFTGGALSDDNSRLRRVAVAPLSRVWPSDYPTPGDRHHCPFPLDEAVLFPNREAVERALGDHIGGVIPDVGPVALAHLPLTVRGENGETTLLGTVEVWRRLGERPPFDYDDMSALVEMTAHAARHLNAARLHLAEHEQVVALQRGILPTRAEAPYVHTAGAYLPTTADSAGVGGDWYDVMRLSGGRMALVVGDVVGHGLAAAATMGRLRGAVQTLAYADTPPGQVLRHLDDLVLRLDEAEPDLGASALGSTLCYLVYDPVDRRGTLASAGHLPLALVHPDGHTEWIAAADPHPPLGSAKQEPSRSLDFTVPDGALLALYTDGLVERTDAGLDAGLEALAAELAAIRPEDDLQEAADRIAHRLVPSRRRDDVTLLLARPVPVPDGAVTTLRLAAGDRAAAATARAVTARSLDGWATPRRITDAVQVVDELVANAVRHSRGDATLRLIRDGARLVVEVTDSSPARPELCAPADLDESGRGLKAVAYLADRWGTRPHPDVPEQKIVWADVPL